MVQLERFDIVLNNPEEAYFAGQEISGKVVIETSEPKKVNEILLELKGRARTYWTKHTGKSRKHCSHSEPYFLEQFNTSYTHKFTVTKDGKEKERILPAGIHEVPFSYTLPKSLPTSFEGEFGHIRYTCKAICERPWDFDIVCRKAFTVIGIEDINSDPKLNEPLNAVDSNHTVALCCRSAGSVSGEIAISKAGYTPGETVAVSYRVTNNSSRTRSVCLKLVQNTTYKAKTFAGHEQVKAVTRIVTKIDKEDVPSHSGTDWLSEDIVVPSLPPRLGKCRIISLGYNIELEIESTVTVRCPIVIGSIPQLSRLLAHSKASSSRENGSVSGASSEGNGSFTNGTEKRASNGHSVAVKKTSIMKESPPREEISDSGVQVRITDESGQTVDDDAMSAEMNALLSARKRVRMPSSILSELYPSMPSPYYRESYFGPTDLTEEKEAAQFGNHNFSPKYPFYTD